MVLLGSEVIVMSIDDARKLVNSFLVGTDLAGRREAIKELQRRGVWEVLDSLRDAVRRRTMPKSKEQVDFEKYGAWRCPSCRAISFEAANASLNRRSADCWLTAALLDAIMPLIRIVGGGWPLGYRKNPGSVVNPLKTIHSW